jgi:phospholipase/carboxylesterase
VRLELELAATSLREGREHVLGPDGQPIELAELPPDAPNIRARSFVFDGFWAAEIELGTAPPGSPLPLVVMFHGRGDRPRIPGGPFGRVPTPMRVIIPRGPLSLGSGYAWARHSVTQNRHEELAADLVTVTDRLVRLIRHVERTRPTAGTPVVTGFSQGAMVAWTLAVRHPTRVGLAIPMAGWVPPAARPRALRASPTRSLHGTDDRIVRIDPTREWVGLLRSAGNDVVFRELAGVGHEITPEMNLQFEEWLEEAMRERAPRLEGGLGERGVDPAPMDSFEPPADVDLEDEAVPEPLPPEAEADAEEPVAEESVEPAAQSHGDEPEE